MPRQKFLDLVSFCVLLALDAGGCDPIAAGLLNFRINRSKDLVFFGGRPALAGSELALVFGLCSPQKALRVFQAQKPVPFRLERKTSFLRFLQKIFEAA